MFYLFSCVLFLNLLFMVSSFFTFSTLDFVIESPKDRDIFMILPNEKSTEITINFKLDESHDDKITSICFEIQIHSTDSKEEVTKDINTSLYLLKQTCIPKGSNSVTISDVSSNNYSLTAFVKGYNEDEISPTKFILFQVILFLKL